LSSRLSVVQAPSATAHQVVETFRKSLARPSLEPSTLPSISPARYWYDHSGVVVKTFGVTCSIPLTRDPFISPLLYLYPMTSPFPRLTSTNKVRAHCTAWSVRTTRTLYILVAYLLYFLSLDIIRMCLPFPCARTLWMIPANQWGSLPLSQTTRRRRPTDQG